MRGLKNLAATLTVAALPFVNSGCRTMYSADSVALPEKESVSTIKRILPVNKAYYPLVALGAGLLGTVYGVDRSARESGCIAPVAMPFALAWGLISTTVDTGINLVAWPYMEVREMVTGDSWEGPYIPNTKSFVDGMSSRSGF